MRDEILIRQNHVLLVTLPAIVEGDNIKSNISGHLKIFVSSVCTLYFMNRLLAGVLSMWHSSFLVSDVSNPRYPRSLL